MKHSDERFSLPEDEFWVSIKRFASVVSAIGVGRVQSVRRATMNEEDGFVVRTDQRTPPAAPPAAPPFKFEVGQEVRTKNIYETGTPGEGEDELYGFVLDAVRGRVGALIEPERGEFVRKLARLCREYEE